MLSDQKEEHEDSYYLVGSAAAEILKAVQSREESRMCTQKESRYKHYGLSFAQRSAVARG
jgi:hypothetical protein